MAIIKGRFKEDGENVVRPEVVNLILNELHYLANMDRSNNSARKKAGKSLPLFRDKDKPSIRIFKCISQIEKYSNALVESSLFGAKNKRKNSQNLAPVPPSKGNESSSEKHNARESFIKVPKKRAIKLSGQAKQSKPGSHQNGSEIVPKQKTENAEKQ